MTTRCSARAPASFRLPLMAGAMAAVALALISPAPAAAHGQAHGPAPGYSRGHGPDCVRECQDTWRYHANAPGDVHWRDPRAPWQRNTAHRPSGRFTTPFPVVVSTVAIRGVGHGYSHGHDHGAYGRPPERVGWCCAQHRSYDVVTGYYIAASGRRTFCG